MIYYNPEYEMQKRKEPKMIAVMRRQITKRTNCWGEFDGGLSWRRYLRKKTDIYGRSKGDTDEFKLVTVNEDLDWEGNK